MGRAAITNRKKTVAANSRICRNKELIKSNQTMVFFSFQKNLTTETDSMKITVAIIINKNLNSIGVLTNTNNRNCLHDRVKWEPGSHKAHSM